MANEDGSEDRLTKNEFAELIQHLSVQEILAVEYRIGTNWSMLFSREHINTHSSFFCNLCILETSSFKTLLAHIDGKKHKLQMERVKQLYHPDYTFPKNDNKEGVGKSLKKKSGDSGSVQYSTTKGIQHTQQNPPVVGDAAIMNTQNIEKNETTNRKSSVQADVQSKLDICLPTSTYTIEQNQIGKGQSKEENNKNSTIRGTIDDEIIIADVIKRKQDINPKINAETLNLKQTSKELKQEIKIVGEKGFLPKHPKRELNSKTRKIVVNPVAAALSLKARSVVPIEYKNTESKTKPQYQTDKVIIPTVHKNKPQNGAASSHSNDFPKFCVKTYSYNLNDNDVYGILGVEYVIKILKTRNDVSPRFECGLCELVFDGFAMQRHLEGYNHRLKYCEKHFPTAIRQYRQYMHNVPEHEMFKVMAPVLARLATAIEQHHGRNLPYECYERDFSLNRHEILAKVFSCRHASEQYGPSFTHVVGSREIDELIINRHNYMPPSFSRTATFDIKPGSNNSKLNDHQQDSRNPYRDFNSRDRHRHADSENIASDDSTYKSYMSSSLHRDSCATSIYVQGGNENVSYIDDETYNLMVDDFLKGTLRGFSKTGTVRENRKRSRSPDRNSNSGKYKLLSPLNRNDIWQAYRHMVDKELYNLDERFKNYRNDPETHPSYNEEWQKFWKRRKDELVSAGLDHRKYNYQPEWVRFVKVRIEEFYGQEVENLKIKCRELLRLPLTNDNIADVKYHIQAPKISSSDELLHTISNTQLNTMDAPTCSTVLNSLNNNVPQIVSLLRLMTALEDSLGSLGPKIIDLLSKALQTEKTNPLYVNAIMLDDENCALIETAKEKFRGLVITGLFDGSKKKVLNQVVNDAETLLKYAYQCKKELASQRSSIQPSKIGMHNFFNSAFPNINNTLKNHVAESNFPIGYENSSLSKTENFLTRVDKKELASKLAASLVAQGKTDFEPQQLQQLIAVYKLIEKKKRENAGTVQSNKEGCSFTDPPSSSKKLSETLSDLLKCSSSEHTIPDVSKSSNASHTATKASNQISDGKHFSSSSSSVFRNCFPPNSFANNLEISSDNYLNYAAQSMSNSFGTSGGRGTHSEQQKKYRIDCSNLRKGQYAGVINNMYNNQYQNNNRVPQNWEWNPNLEVNQNNNMVRSRSNFNQTSNWNKF